MRYHDFDVERQLQNANGQLRQIRDELALANQPPEVRARVQQERAAKETSAGVLLVAAISVVFIGGALETYIGPRAATWFWAAIGWLLTRGIEWAIVLALGLALWSVIRKGVRAAGRADDAGPGRPEI
ncbi:MAG TPA: hypothetical protein VGD56_06770 [Gemmatirosa sp.]